MSSPSSFPLTESGDLSVQFVRRRQVLRVVHADESRSRNAVEVPLPAFLEALGIEPADLTPTRQFLLFAGPDHRAAGGMGDLVATFSTEAESRESFQRIRLSPAYRSGWAQVAEVASGGRTRALCWFGREPSGPHHVGLASTVPPSRPSAKWRRRGRSSGHRT